MADFLLELRSEEIPARMQVKAKEDLARLFAEEIAKSGLKATSIEAFATPRRLALIAHGLPVETAAVSEDVKGPRASAPPQALEGFLRKTGLTRDQLVDRDGVLFAVIERTGRPTADVLTEAVPAIIRAFPWPKSMRWGAASLGTESLRWVRPLQGIVALFGDAVVPIAIEGIHSGRETMGHRFHHTGPVTIGSAADYVESLRAAHVIVHLSERAALIRDGARAAAAAEGLVLVEDEGLVIENAGLTEWPVPLLGRFDPAFLEVPREVIQLTMRTNQKYFACTDAEGKLANAFVCTANIKASDGGAGIVAGNRKVLAARLSDAKFFWEQDLKISLEEQAKKLSGIVFHEKLGTIADKVDRVAKLARWLCQEGIVEGSNPSSATISRHPGPRAGVPLPSDTGKVSGTPDQVRGDEELANLAETAARLCKADLVTGMVGEFPELQGVMGGYYARAQGYPDAVADAIRHHYKPVGQGDDVPTAPVTVAVSLADKLDSVAQFFFAGIKPSGSRDPFALRRAALGISALVVKNNLRIPFYAAAIEAVQQFTSYGSTEVLDFIIDRLKVQQREAGVRHDLIDAVFALGGEDDLVRLLARVKALQAFVTTDEGANLLAGYKRAANILKKSPSPLVGEGGAPAPGEGPAASAAEKTEPFAACASPSAADAAGPSPSAPDGAPPSPARGEGQDAESALIAALATVEPLVAAAIAAEDFEAAMAALARLRAPIDAFFESVVVNDPDPAIRARRLGLLENVRKAAHLVADFSKIEG